MISTDWFGTLPAPGGEPPPVAPPRVLRARKHPVRLLELNIYSADLHGIDFDNQHDIYIAFSIDDRIVYKTAPQSIQDGKVEWPGETQSIAYSEEAVGSFSLFQGGRILASYGGLLSRICGHYISRLQNEEPKKLELWTGEFGDHQSESHPCGFLYTRTVELPLPPMNVTHSNWKPTSNFNDSFQSVVPRPRSYSMPPPPTCYSLRRPPNLTPLIDHCADGKSHSGDTSQLVPEPSVEERENILHRFYTPDLHVLLRPQGKVDLGDGTFLKYGSDIRLGEAARIHYIHQRTSIPVPRVHYAFEHDGYTYIVMNKVEGEPLQKQISALSDAELDEIAGKLVEYIHELRRLYPDDASNHRAMGSWPSGPFDNLWFQPPPVRAFKWIEEMNEYFFRFCQRSYAPEFLETGPETTVVLSHGDLNPTNIMVKDGHITGIVDWETLGFYPDWWECMGAGRWHEPRWQDALHRAWDMIERTKATWTPYDGSLYAIWFSRYVY